MTQSSVGKSTIVRAKAVRLLGALSWLTPALAARLAARLWFTIPATVRAGADVAGGAPFEVNVDGRVVRGHVWGDR